MSDDVVEPSALAARAVSPADWLRRVEVLNLPIMPAWEQEHLRAMGQRVADRVIRAIAGLPPKEPE